MNKQKRFSIILGILIGLLVIGGGAYSYLKPDVSDDSEFVQSYKETGGLGMNENGGDNTSEKVNEQMVVVDEEQQISENATGIIKKSGAIEKTFFVDSFSNLNVKPSAIWDKGDADFILIDPYGNEISADNYEEINADPDSSYFVSWGKFYPIKKEHRQGGSLYIHIFFKNGPDSGKRIAVDGYWTIRAENFKDGFDTFSFGLSSEGENDVFLMVSRIGKESGEDKIEYKINEEIELIAYLNNSLSGSFSGVSVTGRVRFESDQYFRTGKKTPYDDIVQEITFLEKGDWGQKTGIYYYLFEDHFDVPGYYKFEIIANNLQGNALTNHYGYVGYIPEVEKVPPFYRVKNFSIYVD